MSAFLSSFNVVAYVVTFLIVMAGIFAWRRIYSRAISDIQDRVIATQKTAIETLTEQVAALTRQVARLRATISTIRYVTSRHGFDISIGDDYVTIKHTRSPGTSTTARIRQTIPGGPRARALREEDKYSIDDHIDDSDSDDEDTGA